MSFKVAATPNFAREFKPLVKKYPSLKKELQQLGDLLQEAPFSGTALGKGCYKIRLAISSKGKGKSGGARVITYVFIEEETVYLLSIYDKSEQTDIDEKDIQNILKQLT